MKVVIHLDVSFEEAEVVISPKSLTMNFPTIIDANTEEEAIEYLKENSDCKINLEINQDHQGDYIAFIKITGLPNIDDPFFRIETNPEWLKQMKGDLSDGQSKDIPESELKHKINIRASFIEESEE